MTLERPPELTDHDWNRVLASEVLVARLNDERPEAWRLVVFGSDLGPRVTIAAAEFPPTAARPSRPALDRQLTAWSLRRTDEWEETVYIQSLGAEFECLVVPPQAMADAARATLQAQRDETRRRYDALEAENKRKEADWAFTLWRGWTIGLGIAGALLNVLALAPFPASDYNLIRFGICASAIVLAILVRAHKSWGWFVLLVPAAVLWNPIFRIYLDRATWAPLNIIAVIGFAALAFWATKQQRPDSEIGAAAG